MIYRVSGQGGIIRRSNHFQSKTSGCTSTMDPTPPPQGSPASSTTLTDGFFHCPSQGQYPAVSLEQQWPRHIVDSPVPLDIDLGFDDFQNFAQHPNLVNSDPNEFSWQQSQQFSGYLLEGAGDEYSVSCSNNNRTDEDPWTPLHALGLMNFQVPMGFSGFALDMMPFHGGDPSNDAWNNTNMEAACYQDCNTTVTLMPLSASNLSSGNTLPSPLTPSPGVSFMAEPESVEISRFIPPSESPEAETKATLVSRRRRQPTFPRVIGGRVHKKPLPKYKEGQVMFDSIEGRNSGNPRAPFQPERRKEVAAVRARGACFRCRMSKRKCDLQLPCSNCTSSSKCAGLEFSVIPSMPCFQLDLNGCRFFRTKSAAWTKPLREKMVWRSTSQVHLQVQCIYRNGRGPRFTIPCREFKQEETDIVTRKWGREDHQILRIPTFCAANLSVLRRQMPDMVDEYHRAAIAEAVDMPRVMVETFKIATARQDREPLLKAALQIWAGSHFIAASRSLRGEHTLNITPLVGDDSAHDHGNIPIPPMLDYQLDTVAIKWMRETMKNMLKELWEVLKCHSAESWFDVFLVIFILLNNLEYVYEAQLEYAQQHGSARADHDKRSDARSRSSRRRC
ncbi:hypothetical protein BZA05DRAFT_187872 [Tricharina praecox]|uniref:uncharacterized protein n=1 Tax=Tricharina praecox TaxID=43433 RepID=UPI002220FAA7|nr:uncharacterized protein BZA05DRAFT_187872 [Tricharina praecox]KAI5843213.1 hypothetical protein BZA05DRAFT_187872 [Tricharina praecox]